MEWQSTHRLARTRGEREATTGNNSNPIEYDSPPLLFVYIPHIAGRVAPLSIEHQSVRRTRDLVYLCIPSLFFSVPRRLERIWVIICVCRNIIACCCWCNDDPPPVCNYKKKRREVVCSNKNRNASTHRHILSLGLRYCTRHTLFLCVSRIFLFLFYNILCVHLCSLLRLFYTFCISFVYASFQATSGERWKCTSVKTLLSQGELSPGRRWEIWRSTLSMCRSGAYGRSMIRLTTP